MRSLSGRPVSAASIARWAMTGLGLLLALSGCVKGSSTSFGSSIATPNVYTLGGTVAGLGPYSGLVLANGGTTVAVAPRATVFTFPTSLAYGSTYAVTVQASPPGLICSVAGGSGTITANVANIVVNCATQAFTVGGTIAVANSAPGTSVAGLVLANGADTLTVPTGATTFTLATAVAFGSSYQVTVKTQPAGLSCTVNPAIPSTMPANNVTNVAVTCSQGPYALGGTVTINGPTGASLSVQGLVIQNTSNADTYTFTGNASSFTMPKALAFGAAYSLTVTTQPTGLVCAIANPTGTMPAAPVNLAVTCADQSFTLSGSVTINSPAGVTGLSVQGLVLANSANGDTFTFASNAATFTMAQSVPYGSPYSLSVTTQPTGLRCSVTDPSTIMPAANVTTIAVTCADQSFTLGGSIAGLGALSGLVLTNNGADTTSILANAVTFTMNTVVPFGANYDVAVSQHPLRTLCTVAQGTGTMPANNVTSVAVTCTPQPIYAYVTNQYTDTLVGYSVDPTTGALTLLPAMTGNPFATGSNPVSVAVNAAGTFAYVLNHGDATAPVPVPGSLSVYAIDAATGALSEIAGSPYPTGHQPMQVTLNPAGTFAYIANYTDNDVTAYRIDATTGALTPVVGSPFLTQGVNPYDVTVNSAGTLAYVPNPTSLKLSVFAINGATGALAQVAGSPFMTGDRPLVVALNPAGTLAFMPYAYADTVQAYTTDATTGVTTPIAGLYPTGVSPRYSAIVNPAGTVLYIANYGDNVTYANTTVSTYTINPGTGALTPVGLPLVTGGLGAYSIAMNPAGTALYVANQTDGTVSIFSVDPASGALTPQAGSPLGQIGGPNSIVVFQPQ